MSNLIHDPDYIEAKINRHNYKIALEWLEKKQLPACRECRKCDTKNPDYLRKWQYVEWALELARMYLEDEIAECDRIIENY